ncbi:MAG: pyruvate kinase [Candidatus Sumerlaeia bacterium]|nr:pyruvate kinase [Candidatus Sumerlaeia bacterium]
MARTKIVATLGPACTKPQTLRAMVEAGVDIFRLNFSHGTPALHRRWVSDAREQAEAAGKSISILGDLRGPKIRLGQLADERITLRRASTVTLSTAETPGERELPVDFPLLASAVKPGERLLLDDGKIVLVVQSVDGPRVRARVELGGDLVSRKGINLPETDLRLSPLTAKDRDDLERGVREMQLDLVALSFVQRANDIDLLRSQLAELGAQIPVIAKIEKRRALEDFSAILDAADGVMVARGDLGVEIPYERVPSVQKNIIREANGRAKPVITATEMLESMVSAWRPTRAEATDVANAILDGTDALMLSAETAAGHDPVRVVEAMEKIARVTEQGFPAGPRGLVLPPVQNPVPRAMCEAACQIARDLPAVAIVCLTTSGTTARRLAKRRPRAPIYAFTDKLTTARALNLSWGVTPVHCPGLFPAKTPRSFSVETALHDAMVALRERGAVAMGQRIVCVAGLPFNVPGTTNLVAVREVPSA